MPITQREPNEHLSHWYRLIHGLTHTPEEFYSALQNRIAARGLPEVSIGRVTFRQRGLLSRHQEYLRVMRGDLVFDICGAPFGKNAFFVSSWLGEFRMNGCLANALVALPGIGLLVERWLQPRTYYHIDTALMFQESIHTVLLGLVEELTSDQGIEPIPEHERKPSMKKLTSL
jgi:hypothetical protein